MNREMNTALLDRAQAVASPRETQRCLETLFASGCYGDLTAAQHEWLDHIDNGHPELRQAIDRWADRCFRPYYDDSPGVCEKHREAQPEHDCAECRAPLDDRDRSVSLCENCQWFRDYYAENGCEVCGGRLSLTDQTEFQFACRPCRKLEQLRFYQAAIPAPRFRT